MVQSRYVFYMYIQRFRSWRRKFTNPERFTDSCILALFFYTKIRPIQIFSIETLKGLIY